jgi:hypothetical protein
MANSLIGSTVLFGQIAGANNREDLVDIITLTDPYETPGYSMIQKGTASAVQHEWQTEALQFTATGGVADSGANVTTYAEGAAFAAALINDRTRLNNLCEIFRKDIQVSNTQRSVRPGGIKDDYLHQVQVAIKEIGRAIEITLFQGQAGSATGTTGALRTMKTIRNFITTNAFSTSSTAIGATGVGFSTTAWAIGEVMFNGMLEQIFLSGGRADTVFVNGSTKREISRFFGAGGPIVSTSLAAGRRNVDQAGKKLTAAVDVYESDFGIVNIILDRFVGTVDVGLGINSATASGYNRAWFLQLDTWEISVLRPLKHVPLPPGGDAVRGMVLTELTLTAYVEKWNGVLGNIATVQHPTSDGTVTA